MVRFPDIRDTSLTSNKKYTPLPIKKVECGAKFTLAIDYHGNMFTWGKGGDGCLGNGSLEDSWMPVHINYFSGADDVKIVDIAAGAQHAMGLSDAG